MKVLVALTGLAVLAACNPARGYDDDWIARKAQCRAGDFQQCSDIGHEARAQRPGFAPTYGTAGAAAN